MTHASPPPDPDAALPADPEASGARLADGSVGGASGSLGSGLAGSLDGPAPKVSAWRNKRLAKFRLLSLLGQGAMGRVFLAEDTVLRRQVAVKVLAPAKRREDGSSASAERNQRRNRQFLREAQAAAALSHPHIVGVLEVGETKGVAYIAMELVDGGDVKRLIDTGGALSPARACDLAADAAEALAFAHEMGVVHRDVKAANLLITRQGRAKLADFGLADPGDPSDPHRMRDGVIGTPACMSPEVAMGQKATAASDQYSLGCTLWHMLTGEPLFDGEAFSHILEKQVRAVPPPLEQRVPGVPPGLAEVVHRSLAKDPAERHRSCEEFARALRAHAVSMAPEGLSQQGSATRLLAAVQGSGAEAKATGGRGPWIVGGVVAAGVLLVAGVGAGVMLSGGSSRDGETAALAVADPPSVLPVPPASPTALAGAEAEPVAAFPPIETGKPTVAAPPLAAPATVVAGPPPLSPAAASRLVLAVARGEEVAVSGRVRSVQRSATDGRLAARFADAGPDGLVLFWSPAMEPSLGRAFGGTGGQGLVGRDVRVSGVPEFRFGRPALRIRDAAAITLEP